MLAISRDDPTMRDAAQSIVVGWILGSAVSVVSQQAVDRGRRASVVAMATAHARRAHAALELRRLKAVEAIGRGLSEHGPTDRTLDAAMRLLHDEFGYSHPSIYLGDDELIRLGAELGDTVPLGEFPRGRGVIGRVMATRRAELITDVTADPDYVEASPEVRSEIAVPLLAGPRLLGVLNVENRGALADDDLASVSIIADRFAAAIALADRRAVLRTVLEASPFPMVNYDHAMRITYWNAAAADAFGWTADEVLGRPAPHHAPDDPIALDIDRRVAAGGRVSGLEADRWHRDGHAVPVRIFAAPSGDRPPYGTIAVYQDMTAERAASAALVESEARFEAVASALREGVIVEDVSQAILWANQAAAHLLGQDMDQLLGRAPWDPGWHTIHEDGSPFTPDAYPGNEAIRTGEPVRGAPLGVVHADGHTTWLEGVAVPLRRSPDEPPYAVVTSMNDITERKRHEDELRIAERRVRSVLEQAASPIVGVATDGRITFVNDRVTTLFDYLPDELIGRPIEILVPDSLAAIHVVHRERYLERATPRPMGIGLELQARRRDGTLVPVEIAINPVETPDGLEIYATLVDTTERRRIEAELLQAAKMDSIGRLAGGIAHDFNNLLTAIIGYGRIATEDLPPDSAARADVEQMLQAADRAADLTRQLLGFARKTVLAPATHDLNGIVTALEPFLRRLLGEQIALVTHLGTGTGHIRVDRSQIDQILVNLAVNARDAMPAGGTLVVETSAIDGEDVDAALGLTGDRLALLTVGDSGVGMSAEVLARVFEPFYTTKPFGEGTGLGLATTWGIVRQSGGAITVDSEPGAGSTFRIYFPQVPAADAPAAVARGARPEIGAPDGLRTVLVVEDEESVRVLVARMLERLGYRVLQAPNGAAAMSLVGTRLHELDLLLSDVVMPGMRGPELAAALRSLRPELPVVFMSGYADPRDAGGAIPDDAPLLPKPFTLEDLGAAIGPLLGGTADGIAAGPRVDAEGTRR